MSNKKDSIAMYLSFSWEISGKADPGPCDFKKCDFKLGNYGRGQALKVNRTLTKVYCLRTVTLPDLARPRGG